MADFSVSNQGSIFLLTPLTDDAQAWADEHLPQDAMTFGGAIVVEHRFIADIVTAAAMDGLSVASADDRFVDVSRPKD